MGPFAIQRTSTLLNLLSNEGNQRVKDPSTPCHGTLEAAEKAQWPTFCFAGLSVSFFEPTSAAVMSRSLQNSVQGPLFFSILKILAG